MPAQLTCLSCNRNTFPNFVYNLLLLENQYGMTDKIIVLSTCSSREEAEHIAGSLVEAHLAACVNLVPGVTSVFRWQGKLEKSEEILLVIKSRRDLFDKLQERLSLMHTYEVPEGIAIPVVEGLPAYLDWLDRELESPQTTKGVEP
jgi:periplasmic divalent cation tolerance protein